MAPKTEFRCVTCDRRHSPSEGTFTCPDCGPVRGTLVARLDLPDLEKRDGLSSVIDRSLWRYADLLPVNPPAGARPLSPGGTPLVPAVALAKRLGVREVWVKDETRNPSGSLKDRASAMALRAARIHGASTVAAASTGNAASSLACLGAAEGTACVVFVPEDVPRPKLVQVLIHGARVFPVRGGYDRAFDLCAEAVERFGWFSRNTATNPYLGEGKKTVSFEIAEQLGWAVPDRVFVPAGDGCILGGVWKGFSDLRDAGWTSGAPVLVGVQVEGSAALSRAFEAGKTVPDPVVPATVADSLAVALPRDGVKALRASRESGGRFVTVTDEALLEAVRELARTLGLFAEPAGAASLAGALSLAREEGLGKDERVVLLVTGAGWKDLRSSRTAVGPPPAPIDPTIESLEKRLSEEPLN
jgi:threonine synthase